MMRLEILDEKENVVATHKLESGITLLGQSPGAHVHLRGKGIGPLHVGIKFNGKPDDHPVIMDLGGPTPIRVNGKESLEQKISSDSAIIEIGSRRVRIQRNPKAKLAPLHTQEWTPVVERRERTKNSAAQGLVLRVRLYVKGQPQEVVNTQDQFSLSTRYSVGQTSKVVWLKDKKALAQLPAEWIQMGGRIQVGKSEIAKLSDWAQPTELKNDTIYKVFAGIYCLEILVSNGQLIIGGTKLDFFPKELRKPFSVSAAAVIAIFALWMVLVGKPETKVEEPYEVYARTQNIPIEKILEQEKSSEPQAGGGSGSEAKETTSPTVGAAAAAPSKLAQSLTGGLKNLVGNVLSNSKTTSLVVSETGIGQAAMSAGATSNQSAGKLTSVGGGTSNIAGATKLGKLALAGSGQGFSGGSGTGLGTGHGAGVGSGVGNGIGRGGFRLVEEESIVDGGLDKSVIAAVIQNNLSQIKYCYERQLVAEPDLFGKVVVLWTINASGTVETPSVKQTTLNSNPVEQCMLTKIAGWKFPQPKNGTKVTVTYPFLFKSTK